MPDQTPEQREAALKLARYAIGKEGYGVGTGTHKIADSLLDLHAENVRLREAIDRTLRENGHLADGDNCTLIHLKRAISGSPATEATSEDSSKVQSDE